MNGMVGTCVIPVKNNTTPTITQITPANPNPKNKDSPTAKKLIKTAKTEIKSGNPTGIANIHKRIRRTILVPDFFSIIGV